MKTQPTKITPAESIEIHSMMVWCMTNGVTLPAVLTLDALKEICKKAGMA